MSTQIKVPTLVGTPSQVKWAMGIREQLCKQYPDIIEQCSSVYATWWIDARGYTLDKLLEAATKVRSPFTSQFPRYTRADVEPLLRNMGSFAVLDTETSGLTKDSEIVELAIVELNTEEILFDSLLCPKDLPAYLKSKARSIHTISEAAIKQAPTLPEKWDEIRDILSRYHPVSYNWEFDGKMLRRSAMQWGLPTPSFSGTCAMKMFQAFMGSDDYYKLSEACELMGIDQDSFGVAHTAIADTLATCDLLRRMRARIEEE